MMMTSRKHGRASPRILRWDGGVSLLEMLIALSLSMILLTSMFSLYYGAARGAARDDARITADKESRMVTQRLARDLKLVGLIAFDDANGDSNDINRDVPNQTWSDSIRNDFEYATTYQLIITGDIDNDSTTETVRYSLDGVNHTIVETIWEWSRDSLRWRSPVSRNVATHADHLMFAYYDRDGNPIPNPPSYGMGEYILNTGERALVTAVEVYVVVRSDRAENAQPTYLYLPDGSYWYDGYTRVVHRFMVRGRNLSLGA